MTIFLSLFIILYLVVVVFFYVKQESFIFFPLKTEDNFKYNFNANFKEVFYNTPNNGKIHSLRFYAKNSKGIVLYLHGNAGNIETWASVFPQFISRNYDLLVIDFRTYGKSKGKLSEKNFYSDVEYIYKEIQKEFPEEKIIIYGRSLGTGMAVKLCSENNPKSLILESPYYSLASLVKKTMPFLPINFMLKYKFESNKYIRKVKCPIYILHGKKDEVVPFESGKKLYDLVKDKATFIEFEEGTHSNISSFTEYDSIMDMIFMELFEKK